MDVLTHNKNLYEITVASDLSPEDIQMQIQKLPDVKNIHHSKTYYKDGVSYTDYVFGDHNGSKTLTIKIHKLR